MTSLPLLSYKVTEEDSIVDRSNAFTLYHTGKIVFIISREYLTRETVYFQSNFVHLQLGFGIVFIWYSFLSRSLLIIPGEKKLYFFQAESEAVRKQWINVLEKVVKAEIPKNTMVSKPSISS